MVPSFTLYVREGCHLCEDLEAQLHELLPAGSFSLQRVDIDDDPVTRQSYNDLVPVLMHEDREICHHFLDLHAVRGVLAGYNLS